MISALDFRAYTLKIFFNLLGRLGGSVLNRGLARGLDVFPNLCYGSAPEQCLDLFRPRTTRRENLPILIFFHGGGWISADRKIYRGIAATFSHAGFLTFNLDYRLAPKSRFPAPLQDAVRALDWIGRNAERYGGDRSVILLAGDSAGAQIASWYASALESGLLFERIGIRDLATPVSVKGLLLFYGVYDFDTLLDAPFPFIETYARSFLGADSHTYARSSHIASPIRLVSPDLPPVWLCAGERDGLFAQSRAYADALRGCGASCQTLFFPPDYRANHGFLFFRWLRSSRTAITSAVDFARACARDG